MAKSDASARTEPSDRPSELPAHRRANRPFNPKLHVRAHPARPLKLDAHNARQDNYSGTSFFSTTRPTRVLRRRRRTLQTIAVAINHASRTRNSQPLERVTLRQYISTTIRRRLPLECK